MSSMTLYRILSIDVISYMYGSMFMWETNITFILKFVDYYIGASTPYTLTLAC
jgi:hypothetical protein